MKVHNLLVTGSLTSGGENIGSISSSVATTNNTQDNRISSLEVTTGSLNTHTSSVTIRLNSIETTTGSLNVFTSSTSPRLNSVESKTGSYATTGSNAFIGTQTITGSLFISSNLVVQGSSSLQNITASAVNIGANIVNLNTANPAIRFAGLNIFDSGSIGGSGSFLYDAVQDEFIFIHRGDNTNITSSIVLMGPQTYNNVGNETYPTVNRLLKGTGNEHVGDSIVSEIGEGIGISGSLSVTGSATFSSTIRSDAANGLGIGSISGYRRVQYDNSNTKFGFLTDGNGLADIEARKGFFSTNGASDSTTALLANASTNDSTTYAAIFGSLNSGYRMVVRADGNVGIGVTTPLSKFHVNTGTNQNFRVRPGTDVGATNGVALNSRTDDDGSLQQLTLRASDVIMLTSGNVGIGTTGPATFLHVAGTSAKTLTGLFHTCIQDFTTMAAGVGGGITFMGYKIAQSNQEAFAGIDGFKENGTSGNAAGAFRILTQPSSGAGLVEQMRITSGGNLGIGVIPASVSKLQVKVATNVNLSIRTAVDISGAVVIQGISDSANDNIPIEYRATAHYFAIGNVGIGTVNPTNRLHLTGDSATPSLRLGSISVGYHYDIGRENATTGDFLINATVNGVSQGTYLRISQSGGAVTKGFQPFAMGALASNQSISASTFTPLAFQTNQGFYGVNTGGCWNNSTYTFTAPVTGVYIINVSLLTNCVGQVALFVNGVRKHSIPSWYASSSITWGGSALIPLTAGQALTLQGYGNAGTVEANQYHTFFSIYLLG